MSISTIGRLAAFTLSTLVLAYAAGASALSQAALMTAPDVALRLAPTAGRAEAIVADRLTTTDGARTDLARVEKLAARSLTHEPLNAVALRVLGVVADARGQKAKAMRFFALSEATSRRDLGTQLALIQFASDAGDLPRTLKHYDILMRTSVHGQTLLFPILAQGLEDAEIRAGLARNLMPLPPWLWPFVNHAIARPEPPVNLAMLLMMAMKSLPDDDDYKRFHTRMLTALVDADRTLLAARYFVTLPGAQAELLRSADIAPQTTDPRFVPITWEVQGSTSTGATIEGGASAFRVFASPGERASVLRRALLLQPGNYSISIDQEQVAPAEGHGATWSITCGGKPIWSVTVAGSQRGSNAPFMVPVGCSNQMITLDLAGGSDQSTVEYLVRGVSIRRGASSRTL